MKKYLTSILMIGLLAVAACDQKDHPHDPNPNDGHDEPIPGPGPFPIPLPGPGSRLSHLSSAEKSEVRALLLKDYQESRIQGDEWKVVGAYRLRQHLQEVLRMSARDFDDPIVERDFVRLYFQLHDANGGVREK
jgi:hypothetical protein